MTNLQIAYQQLLETQRANRANEALKGQQVAVSAYEAATKAKETEAKLPLYSAQVQDTLKSAEYKDSQMAKIAAEIPKLLAETSLTQEQEQKVVQEIGKVIMDTQLSEAQKEKVIKETKKVITERLKLDAEIAKTEADTTLSKARVLDIAQNQRYKFADFLTRVRDDIINQFKISPEAAKLLLSAFGG